MDFLLSFRSLKPSVDLKPIQPIETPFSYINNSYLNRYLLLTVTNYKWKFFIFQTIFFRIVITTYAFTFTSEKKKAGLIWFDYINIVFDVLFLFDFISALIYRCIYPKESTPPELLNTGLKRLAWRSKLHQPRKIWMLVIDFITIIPFELLRFLTPLHGDFRTACYYVTVLRIYRPIFLHLESLKRVFLSNTLIRLLFKCGMLWLTTMHIFTCIYHWVSWDESSKLVKNIEEGISYNKQEPFNLYIIIYYLVQFSFENIGFGELPPTTDRERVALTIATIVGFSMLNGYIISSLSNALKEKMRRISIFRLRLFLMSKELSYRRVPAKKIEKIMNFYRSLWVFRKGVGPSDALLVSFPHSIWSSVYYDIFENALNASILFRSCDEPSKRAIARVMTTELYTTGDAILSRHRSNSRMFYVRKGTVQIMSHEDDETPITTFGAGSVFGQVSLLLSVPTVNEVHAVAFCEIQVLSRRKLFGVLKDYPKAKDLIFNVYKNLLLNAMADKFHPDSGEKVKPENVLPRDSIYKIPKTQSKVAQNDICAVSTCPYVFEPWTVFLKVWDVLVVVIIVIICFYYPYYAAYRREYPTGNENLIIIFDVILILNLYLKFSTAISKENILFSNLREIVTTKLSSVFTYVDIIAVMPLHYFIKNDSRVKSVLLCLRCLEIYQIHVWFLKMESSVSVKIGGFLRLIKCILYFFLIGYFYGILYYLEACYDDPCVADSWYMKNNITQAVNTPVLSSLYIAILLASETGFGDIVPKNTRDVAFIIAFSFFGAFLFTFLESELSAYLSLKREPIENFTDFAQRIKSFLKSHRITNNEIIRVRQYLNLQWEWNMGYEFTVDRDLFYDTPKHMMIDFSQHTKVGSLIALTTFVNINANSINPILTSTSRIILPPHEVVIYAGEVCTDVLVLQEGFCEITYGKDVSVKKIITAGEELCFVEIMLGMTSLCHVRTLTHCIFFKIPKEGIIGIFKLYPLISAEVNEAVAEFKKTQIFQEVQKIRPVHLQLVVRPTSEKSFYCFRYFQKHDKYEEFKAPFMKLGMVHWVRFFLGRTTILPYGKFLKIWEISRCLFAFSSAILFPLLPFFELQVPALYYVGLFLDISAWLDLYLRMHVCYYNNKNLLVSHPLATTMYYLKGNFILDFSFCFPLDRIMFRRVHDREGLALVTTLRVNNMRLLRISQIYRIPPIVNSLGVDFLSPPSLIRVFVMVAAMTVVFLNTWASLLILFCFNYEVDREEKYILLISSTFNTTTEPFSIFLADIYWIAETAFSVGYGDITAETTQHMVFVVFEIIISYLFLGFMSVYLLSFLSVVNENLTLYQTRMRDLVRFLKVEKVNPFLKKHTINHFEEEWKKTKGMKARYVFTNFHTALENDLMLYLYADTIKSVGAFADMNHSLIRTICNQVRENNYIEGATLYKTKDIVSEVYIISQGEVTLIRDNETVILRPFEIFGLLENAAKGLTKESAKITKNATILTITTTTLYKLYVDFHVTGDGDKQGEEQKLRSALDKSNAFKTEKFSPESKKTDTLAYVLFKFSKHVMFFYAILSWFSVNEVSYTIAFHTNGYTFLYVAIPIEVLFVVKIIFEFTTGYLNESGEFISSYRKIRRNYLKSARFYVDVISVLPFEVFCLAFHNKNPIHAFKFLRISKYLRGYTIQQFFSLEFETLRVNMTLLKMLAVIMWSSTLLHQCSCVWYFVTCPWSHCPNSVTWNVIHKGFRSPYITSLYFIVVLLTTTGTGDVTPHAPDELAITIVFMIFAFFQEAIFTGQIISTSSRYFLAKTNYEYAVNGLKTYLAVNDVSKETQGKVFRYIGNIWRHKKGEQIPKLLQEGPSYLLHEIKQSTYGHHINDNPVFGPCDPSFRNLIINELHRTVYFAGDVIVYEGEVNRTMYFVHIGLVESKNFVETLQTKSYPSGKFFGLKQGVRDREPHLMTYTAMTYCVILSLNLKHWKYLSEFFPQDVDHVRKETEDNKWI